METRMKMDLGYLASYNNDALREIIYKKYEQYEYVAVQKAKEVLFSRYETLLSTESGDSLPFGCLLPAVGFDGISPFLQQYLHKKPGLSPYQSVFMKLSAIEPDAARRVVFEATRDPKTGSWDAAGNDADSGEELDLSFLTWREWLSVPIQKELILRLGVERIAALALYKMTVNGFSEGDTANCLRNLQDLAETNFEPAGDEEETGAADTDVPSQEPQTCPWSRYFARCFDYSFFDLLFTVIWCFTGYSFPHNQLIRNLVLSLSLLLWAAIEALLLSTWGTTPGKFLFRIAVRRQDGSKPDLKQALSRSVLVWAIGFGCGIVFTTWITGIFNFIYLRSKKYTWYDKKTGFEISYGKISFLRAVLIVISLLALPVFSLIIQIAFGRFQS